MIFTSFLGQMHIVILNVFFFQDNKGRFVWLGIKGLVSRPGDHCIFPTDYGYAVECIHRAELVSLPHTHIHHTLCVAFEGQEITPERF